MSSKKKQNIILDIARFEEDIKLLFPRFLSNPHTEEKVLLKDLEGKELKFFQFFPEEFEDWREANDWVEKKSCVYRVLDKVHGHELALWQLIERCNDDCQAERAIEISKHSASPEDKAQANYWNALARSYFILTDYDKALECTLKARDRDENNYRTWRVYADTLFETGDLAKAQEIYHRIVDTRAQDLLESDAEESFETKELLGFEGDVTFSPIYARAYFLSNEDAPIELLEWAEKEFSFSPHFRSFAAIKLLETGAYAEAVAKLVNLTRQMPWFMEAVVNALSLIEQLDLSEELKEDKLRLEKIVMQRG